MVEVFSFIPCPWVWVAGDPQEQIIFTVNWDTATSEIMSAIVFRDIDCIYDTIYLGSTAYPVAIGETLLRYRDFPPDSEFNVISDIINTPISVSIPQAFNFSIAATLEVP
jgi:hypothetical protein